MKQKSEAADERCPSRIEGLDDILAGGLPRDCFYLIQGDLGSGKTTMALQLLLEGLRRGEKVFYITLSETRDELFKVARSHGWTIDEIPLLSIIKKRSGHHEKTIRELRLEKGKGIRIGPPLKEFQGVLTGIPTFHGARKRMLKTSDARK